MMYTIRFFLFVALASGRSVAGHKPFHGQGFLVRDIDPGRGTIGSNEFSFTVENTAGSRRPLFVSLRSEGGGINWQKGYYLQLESHETTQKSLPYYVPDRGNRVLKAYFGIPESMPTADDPYPEAGLFKTLLFAPESLRRMWQQRTERFHFWERPSSDQPVSTNGSDDSIELRAKERRKQLRELLRWDRPHAEGFRMELIERYSVGNIDIQSLRITGEPHVPVRFLLLRPAAASGALPTVVYLGGNPTGAKKESNIGATMSIVEAGYQVACIDRRETAIHTDPGEFVMNIADPVYDARRLVDYLVTRSDVTGRCVSMIGFSGGAWEGQFLLALHDAVRLGVLVARPIDHAYLFESTAWWPTLYDPDVLPDIGLPELVDAPFRTQLAALTPERSRAALRAYRERYPFFEALNPTRVLSLAAPKPLLVITGALDEQFPLAGVLALDDELQREYRKLSAEEASALFVMARRGHELAPEAIDLAIDFLQTWVEKR